MGVPLPNHDTLRPAQGGQANEGRSMRDGHGLSARTSTEHLDLASEARLRNLLLAARTGADSAAERRAAAPLLRTYPIRHQQAAAAAAAALPSPQSPPPLAPPSDSDDDSDWDELPALLSDSPASTQRNGSRLDDLFCPWVSLEGTPRPAPVLRHAAFRTYPSSRLLADSYLPRSALRGGLEAAARGSDSGGSLPAAEHPLDAEVSALANKLAQLVQARREQLDAADPSVRAGLFEAANQLASLARVLQAGPPPRL